MVTKKTLIEMHEDVPANHYDLSIKRNLFQKYWHSRRFAEILKVIRPVKGPTLDIGCHSGTFTQKILTKVETSKIYGIDISASAISLIKKRIPDGNFQMGDAKKLPYNSNFFSAVFCLEMLEHVDNPIMVLKEIKRVLHKRGYCVILIPTDNSLFRIIWFLWTLYYPVWRHTHVQSFKNQKLENILNLIGFKISFRKTFNLGMLKILVLEKNNRKLRVELFK